jgi:hypothetical protein
MLPTIARVKEYRKDPNTSDTILIALITDADGKPTEETVEIHLSQEGFQKLIREALPVEEQRIQEALDKIHAIRMARILTVEKIDDAINQVMDDSKNDFTNCGDKEELAKMSAIYRVKLLALGQKRLLAKFAMHEESELVYQITKIRQGKE